jgi:peptidoglycan/LPS O-acetylase OafA/YrhL
MKINFRRIISKGSFIPEIDGLRFIAIMSVLMFHLQIYLSKKDNTLYTEYYSFNILRTIFSHGHIGVPLFFAISGFILARPFANNYLKNSFEVNIKKYFLRRLTRLEPPYFLVMTLLLFASIYVTKTISLEDGVLSYLSSITYTHNFFYGKEILPRLNGVAWSLEIEVQFYILMPFIAKIFTIKDVVKRRMVIVILTVLFVVISHVVPMSFISIINYIEYFFIGILLADLYVEKDTLFAKSNIDTIFSLFFFSVLWLFDVYDFESIFFKIIWEIIQVFSMFIFFYLVLFHNSLKLLTFPLVTNIGGMCYTIYLIHYPIISFFGKPLMEIVFSDNLLINTTIYSVIFIFLILLLSSLFYLLVERPCMDKDWFQKFSINKIFRKCRL